MTGGDTAVGEGGQAAAAEILDRLLAVAGGLHHLLTEVAARHDLTPQQVVLLRSLDAPRPMRALACAMRCDPSNVTGLMDRVERRGLVERVADPGDRRVRLLSLTEPGRRVRDDIHRELVEVAILRWLTNSEIEQFRDWLRRIRPVGADPCGEDADRCGGDACDGGQGSGAF